MSLRRPLPTPAARPAIASALEAEKLMAHLDEVMNALLAVVEQETHFVRTGRLGEASRLEATKTELAGLYFTATERLKSNVDYFSAHLPNAFAALRRRHETFRAVLQMNLTVLATAHAVSEGIIRGVMEEVTQKHAPQSYGATGRANLPRSGSAQPVAVSRSL